jgi:leader peptidase (prepilin peptidase)/N-methyltransferase
MEIFWQIIIFILGLIVGSFLNCVIFRLEKEESFLMGRSYCPKCGHKLNWRDLVPILSFIFLKGRCYYCKEKISWQYPIVEISTALIFLLIFNFSALGGSALGWQSISSLPQPYFNLIFISYLFLVFCFLMVIFVSDLKTFIIPDKIIFPAIAVVFIYRVFGFLELNHWKFIENWNLEIENLNISLNYLYSGIAAGLFFLLIFLVSRGKWMGFGDVKLAFFMGLFLGFPKILVALFLSFFLGAIIGIGLVLTEKKKLKSEIPFGPFLIIGTFIAFFWGSGIANWYFNLLGL